MPDLSVTISGYVAGDNLEIRTTVTELPSPIATAWLTVKRHHRLEDEDAALRKEITTTEAEDVGQIEIAGGEGVSGVLRFELTAEETRGLGTRPYVYDVQVQLEDESIYTPQAGTLTLSKEVTLAPEPEPEP